MQSSNNIESSIPQLNTPWVDSPFFEAELAQSDLDPESQNLVRQFADCGYLIIDNLMDDFDALAADILGGLEAARREKNITQMALLSEDRIQDAWVFDEAVKHLAIAPKVLSILRLLYRREPIPFQTLNFWRGTQQKTHSDTIHFSSFPQRFMCGVWVALEDIDVENGPLHYYPGSHKLPILQLHDLGLTGTTIKPGINYRSYTSFVAELLRQQGFEKIDISLSKGQAIVWSANLFHGGSPILDFSRTRHSQVTHYYFSDCLYYTPLFSNLPLGQIYLRTIRNIGTGESVPHVYNGQILNLDSAPADATSSPYSLAAGTAVEISLLKQHLEKIEAEFKAELKRSQDKIAAMESSRFWKLRDRWFALKEKLGWDESASLRTQNYNKTKSG